MFEYNLNRWHRVPVMNSLPNFILQWMNIGRNWAVHPLFKSSWIFRLAGHGASVGHFPQNPHRRTGAQLRGMPRQALCAAPPGCWEITAANEAIRQLMPGIDKHLSGVADFNQAAAR
jgi:hypothetical protein